MRKNLGKKTWMVPLPVLILGTYDENGVPNAMNAAWGGIYDYEKVIVSLSEHKTTDNLRLKKAFTIAFATKKTVVASDYVGVVSGKKVHDKVAKAGLHAVKAEHVDAPIFEEYPLVLECEVESFEEGILIGKIINVSVDEAILTDDKIDYDKAEFIAFDATSNKYMLVKGKVADALKIGMTIH